MKVGDLVFHHLRLIIEQVSQKPVDWPFAFFLPIFIGVALAHSEPFRERWKPLFKPFIVTTSLVILGITFHMAVFYLSTNFIENTYAVLVAMTSWLFHEGQPVYSNAQSLEPYSLPYGPYTYVIVSSFQQVLGPGMFSSKLAPFLAAMASWIFLYLALRNRAGWVPSLALTALASALLTPFDPFQYWPRPDPFILLAMAGGLWAATRREAWGPILLGCFAGLATNLKIYSIVFFLVAIVWAWRNHKSILLWVLTGVVAAVTAFLPFAWSNVSLEDYHLILKMDTGTIFQDVLAVRYAEWWRATFHDWLVSAFYYQLEYGCG